MFALGRVKLFLGQVGSYKFVLTWVLAVLLAASYSTVTREGIFTSTRDVHLWPVQPLNAVSGAQLELSSGRHWNL